MNINSNVNVEAPPAEGGSLEATKAENVAQSLTTERDGGCSRTACCASDSKPVWTFELIDEEETILSQYHVNIKTLRPHVVQSCLNHIIDDILEQSLSLAGKAFRVRPNELNHVLERE